MAPEQLNGSRSPTRGPMCSRFGVVLYEYASGVHPFEAPTPLGAGRARVLESDAGAARDRAPATLAGASRRSSNGACARRPPTALRRRPRSSPRLTSRSAPPQSLRRCTSTWWRHASGDRHRLYFVAAPRLADQGMAARPALTRLFVLVGIAAAIAGVFRGHLLFTERMSTGRALDDRAAARPSRSRWCVDLLIAAAHWLVDGLVIAARASAVARADDCAGGRHRAGGGSSSSRRRRAAGGDWRIDRMIAIEIQRARRAGSAGAGRAADARRRRRRGADQGGGRRRQSARRDAAAGRYPPPPGASDIPGLEVAGTIVAGRRRRRRVASRRPGLRARLRRRLRRVLRRAGAAVPAGAARHGLRRTPPPFPRRSSPCGPTSSSADGCSRASRFWFTAARAASARPRFSWRARSARVCSRPPASAEKCAACETLGAERAINYREADFVAAIRDADRRPRRRRRPRHGRRRLPAAQPRRAGDGGAAGADRPCMGGVEGADQPGPDAAAPADDHRFDAAAAVGRRERARSRAALRAHVWPLLESGAVRSGGARDVSAARRPPRRTASWKSSAHIGKLVLSLTRP